MNEGLMLACSVCYGDPQSPLTMGLNLGIITLLLVTGFVLSAFSAFFVYLFIKSREQQ